MMQDLEARRRRALYRAGHRGMKEMDWVLGKFAEAKVGRMSEAELVAFERLLAIADPELHQWVVEPEVCINGEFAPLLREIRAFHDLSS